MTETALYRHFDAEGRLLYVGISLSAVQRLSQHARSAWAQDIRNIRVEMFQTREDALTAESDAIRAEKPLHNKQSGVWRVNQPEAPEERPENLLTQIKAYCAAAEMKPSVFGLKAVNDGKLVSRLEAGGECLPRTGAKILRYIAQNPPKPREMQGAA